MAEGGDVPLDAAALGRGKAGLLQLAAQVHRPGEFLRLPIMAEPAVFPIVAHKCAVQVSDGR